MGSVDTKLKLRTASVDDVEIVADLGTLYDPDDPRDPVMLRFY